MGKAWSAIKGFFSGGDAVSGPTASELYSGPGASWGATANADGTWSGSETAVENPEYAAAQERIDRANITLSMGNLVSKADRARAEADLREAQAVPRTITRREHVPAAAQVRGNQTGVQAAMQALANTQRIANTGWTAQDRAAMGAADRASQRSAQAAIGALAQQGRMRGTSGSGQQFAAMAGAAQQAANASADRGAAIAQQGADRRAQASQALAGMGMGMDAQTFGQNAQRAGAVDEFNRFATGAQGNAAQQAYQNKRQEQQDQNEMRKQRWDSIMSAAGSFSGVGG